MTRFNDNGTADGIEGYYLVDGYVLKVFVQATNHWKDWVANFLPILRADIYGQKAQRHYARAARWLVDMIKDTAPEFTDIELYGHSKGGAEAEIAAWIILNEWQETRPPRLYTFGGARALSRGYPFALHYEHRGDPVPYVPPWPFYRRRGRRIRFGTASLDLHETHGMAAYQQKLEETWM